MSDRGRTVVVLSHAALPRTEAGGTRHVELFSRLDGWNHVIVASNRSNYTRAKFRHRSSEFVTVPTPGYGGNGVGRVLNWLSYCVGAFLVGVRRRRVRVVYASSPHLLAPVAGLLIAKVRRAAFVLEVRDLWPRTMVEMGYLARGSRLHRILVAIEGRLYRSAARIVATTDSYIKHIASFGVPAEKVEVISNGAQPADLVPTVTREQARADLGVDGFVAIYAGAHGPANGLDQVLDVAGELTDCVFLLVGDGLEKERLRQRAEAEKLDNVLFCAPVPKSELPNLLVAADVGLHVLSDVELFHEGISSNKLYDYMAFGLPAISNVRGEPAEALAESGGGLSCEPDKLAEGLRRLRSIPYAERVAMGARGQGYVELNKSRTVMAGRLQALLDASADRGKTSVPARSADS